MLRMTKQTDYGFVLMTRLVAHPDRVANAPELAGEARLPLPMVAKILKLLVRHGLLSSQRGVKGGYRLARPPQAIAASEIIAALEGAVGLTVCVDGRHGECEHESYCDMRPHWHEINRGVARALAGITLADLAAPASARLVRLGGQTSEAQRAEAPAPIAALAGD